MGKILAKHILLEVSEKQHRTLKSIIAKFGVKWTELGGILANQSEMLEYLIEQEKVN